MKTTPAPDTTNTRTQSAQPQSQHTPGPWQTAGRAIYTPSAWKNGRDSGQVMVAQCFAEPDREMPDSAEFLGAVKLPGNDCEADANARLIASAPELLAALEAWLNCHDTAGTTPSDEAFAEPFRSILKQARAAIAKAQGGAL